MFAVRPDQDNLYHDEFSCVERSLQQKVDFMAILVTALAATSLCASPSLRTVQKRIREPCLYDPL